MVQYSITDFLQGFCQFIFTEDLTEPFFIILI